MKIAYYQQDIVWENTGANLVKIEKVLPSVEQDTDLLVLPEMFNAGFTMNPSKIAEPMEGNVVRFLKKNADRYGIAFVCSTVISEYGKFYNRLLVVFPGGKIITYDKRHLFSVGGENMNYTRGGKRVVTKVKDVRIMPLICYDLRFPVWSRSKNDYDILIYIANWPASRSEVWRTLLKARAIENQCYVVGVNRVGKDDSITYTGDSMVVDAKGKIISEAGQKEGLCHAELDMNVLKDFRAKFPVWKDADSFELKI